MMMIYFDDNDVDDDHVELFLRSCRSTKSVEPYSQPGPLSESLVITNL